MYNNLSHLIVLGEEEKAAVTDLLRRKQQILMTYFERMHEDQCESKPSSVSPIGYDRTYEECDRSLGTFPRESVESRDISIWIFRKKCPEMKQKQT